MTREEAIDFARRYDPQPFHLDDDAAAANPLFGRLVASGWHTAAIAMRLTVELWARHGMQSLGGAGLEELVWPKPVYPGDTLRLELEVIGARPLRSWPGVGMVKVLTVVLNQHDEPVMRQVANVMVGCRPVEDQGTGDDR